MSTAVKEGEALVARGREAALEKLPEIKKQLKELDLKLKSSG